MPPAPAPEFVSALKKLRGRLASLETCQSHELANLLTQHPQLLKESSVAIAKALDDVPQPLLAATFRHLVADGAVTRTVPAFLHRLHAPGSSTSGPSSTLPAPHCTALPGHPDVSTTLAATNQLTTILGSCVYAALELVESPEAVAAGAAFMQALARARPCGALANAMAVARAAPLSSSNGDPAAAARRLGVLGSQYGNLTTLGMLLLRHSLQIEPASAALREDMATSPLLREACDGMTLLLAGQYGPCENLLAPVPVSEAAMFLAFEFNSCIKVDEAANDAGGTMAAAWRGGPVCAAMQAATAEPAFPRMLLAALCHPGPTPHAPAGEVVDSKAPEKAALLQALDRWLRRAYREGPAAAARISAVGITLQQVESLAYNSSSVTVAAVAAVQHMVLELGPDDQLLAYPAVAALSGQLLDQLVEWYRSRGASDVFARGGLADYAADIVPEHASVRAVALFALPFEVVETGGKQRARSLFQVGLLGKTEALLRARVVAPLAGAEPQLSCHPAQLKALVHLASRSAAAATAAMLDDPADAPMGMAAYQPLQATLRKLVAWRVQEAEASSNAEAPGTTLDTNKNLLSTALAISLSWAPLMSLLATEGPSGAAARLAVQCCALQLLPGLVGERAPLWQAGGTLSDTDTIDMLDLLALLQPAGMGDIALAAGMPGLLVGLLQSQRTSAVGGDFSLDVDVLAAAVRVAAAAAQSDAWLRHAARLGLAEEMDFWVLNATKLDASARGDPVMIDKLQLLVDGAKQLSSQAKALPAAMPDVVAPTWDSCALTTVAEAAAAGCVPFLGCWNRNCTNLDGDSEAALKLLRCANCGLARYCCLACQKAAWTAGHRAACSTWKTQHAAPLL